ncbi:hypothetical protein OCK74_25525 [Chitinophagaceae bacterium LB-8]|jgi:hypothetical protein|uniref:Uncharacterized protein n=1 Tax=Paraflavisolibacter caeni TaxID=2982496 RepID=A0A9X2Y0P0_9BACT|nr:hypothetical protein [Paraflavisolibacter caeni]MCU7552505.1 hypothetical protein [Paraflavisolibacter caeni]
MQDNLKDILSNLSTNVDQETLLLYLQGKLSPEKQHEVEKQITDSEFDSDAFEGLQKIKDQQRIKSIVHQLHYDLKKKTAKKKATREKLRLKEDPLLMISIIIILLLIIISFMIIHRHG